VDYYDKLETRDPAEREAALFAERGLSWQAILVGDPLYRPFAVSLEEQWEHRAALLAGRLQTASFIDFVLPSIDQAPDTEVSLLELPSPHGPFGAKGVGEPPAVPAPPAVANAIHAACGRRLTTLPADFVVPPESE